MPNRRQLEIAAEALRKGADGLLVLVIAPDWGYVATDPRLMPRDAIETLRNEIPRVEQYLREKKGTR